MKTLLFTALVVLGATCVGCDSTKVNTRNYAYEAYCDSIWQANPDYYIDVLEETEEYQEYIETYGEWF